MLSRLFTRAAILFTWNNTSISDIDSNTYSNNNNNNNNIYSSNNNNNTQSSSETQQLLVRVLMPRFVIRMRTRRPDVGPLGMLRRMPNVGIRLRTGLLLVPPTVLPVLRGIAIRQRPVQVLLRGVAIRQRPVLLRLQQQQRPPPHDRITALLTPSRSKIKLVA